VSAEDRDGLPEHSAFVYAFDGGSTWTNEFSIDAHTGLIVTRRPLDREVSLPHRPVDDISGKSYKKLSYRRGTARCVASVEILPIATQQCRNYLYDKS